MTDTPTIEHDNWQSGFLLDENGAVLSWEFNCDLILRNDPGIKHVIQQGHKEPDRAAIDALLFLQSKYRIRISYSILLVMVKLLAENNAKATRRAAMASDAGYFSR